MKLTGEKLKRKQEIAVANAKKGGPKGGLARTIHGHTAAGVTSLEYGVWEAMRRRCGPGAKGKERRNYFDRGVRVCGRWQSSFEAFLEDMGARPSAAHSLDRYPDNRGNYEKSNCRWATGGEQSRNSSLVHMVSYDGIELCLTDWAARFGISYSCLRSRLDRGWTMDEIAINRRDPSKYNRATGDRCGSRKHPERLARGERHYAARLTAAAVREIRAQYAVGGVTQAELAARYGVASSTVSMMLRGATWKGET